MGLVTVRSRDPDVLKLAHATLCFLEGSDVTEDCFEANNEEGWASLYVRDGRGLFVDDGGAVEVTVHGHVEFKERVDEPMTPRVAELPEVSLGVDVEGRDG